MLKYDEQIGQIGSLAHVTRYLGDSLLAKYLKSKCAQYQWRGSGMQKDLSASDAHGVLSGAHQRHGSLEGNAPKCVEFTSTLSNFKWSSLTCGDWRAS